MVTGCVMPTCRQVQASAFLREWAMTFRRHAVQVFVVEDGPARTFSLDPPDGVAVRHLCWSDAPAGMLDCISVRSPGCRHIGLWHAWRDGCDVIVTLDDDVRPLPGECLIGGFAAILTEGLPRWVDPLLNYRSRGYPERNTGRMPVAFHVGAFFGIPDVDGETQLRHEAEFATRPPVYVSRPTILPAGQLAPVNGGICGWQRDLTPFVHYTLWDAALGYRRFDDIWMGVILKQVLDLAGRHMSFGPPGAMHGRASDAAQNAVHERQGKEWNEAFWEALLHAVAASRPAGVVSLDEAWAVVADAVAGLDNAWARREAAAMRAWRALFQ